MNISVTKMPLYGQFKQFSIKDKMKFFNKTLKLQKIGISPNSSFLVPVFEEKEYLAWLEIVWPEV